MIDNTDKAIAKINESGYPAILITNQPVVARGECSIEELNEIHNCLETLLGQEGADLDDIFFCPHHNNILHCKNLMELLENVLQNIRSDYNDYNPNTV